MKIKQILNFPKIDIKKITYCTASSNGWNITDTALYEHYKSKNLNTELSVKQQANGHPKIRDSDLMSERIMFAY